jgi:isoleucyl-tRNA synthetase
MFKKVDSRKKYSEMEKEVMRFWKEDGTFQKSVELRSKDKYYSFYDGPPFITGVPHYGTLLSSIVKDAVPRYFTMKGYRVERRWGWDCHGLPAENMVEKKLGLKSKKDIEKIGVGKFNEACLRETSQIASEWEDVIDRIGRWVEFKGAYKTMDKGYMESVWWAFSEMHKKGLIYEDVRVSLYCPRCSTPLSNFEIAMDNSYEMDSDPSVYVEMSARGGFALGGKVEGNTRFLVWTTTPWTLLANVALAIGKNIDYVIIEKKDEGAGELVRFILAKERLEKVFGDDEYKIIKEMRGADLVGMEYEPIFPHEIENGYRVIAGDFVTTEDGSGIVHIAPAFGEDDFQARKPNNLPIIMNVDEEGQFLEGEWQGQKVWDANGGIVKWLKEKNFLFKREQITHSYPHCHRCHTKLIYKAQPAWYVNVDKIRQDLLSENEKINWYPEFLKHGRFQNGIYSAPDWNI